MTTPTSAPTVIDATELSGRLAGPTALRVLDVRTPAEFESAHIPGSTCAMGMALSRMPRNRGSTEVDITDVLASLAADA